MWYYLMNLGLQNIKKKGLCQSQSCKDETSTYIFCTQICNVRFKKVHYHVAAQTWWRDDSERFSFDKFNATAKLVALDFVENAMTVEWTDVLYQIEALVKIASETPPVRQTKHIELLLEIQRLAIVATGGSHLIDYLDWQSYYGNDFLLLDMMVIEEKSSNFRGTWKAFAYFSIFTSFWLLYQV